MSQATDCKWACNIGYLQSSSGESCSPCPTLPTGAVWDSFPDSAACSYRCASKLYGHPRYLGVCLACSVLQSTYVKPAPVIPFKAVWDDSLDWCNASAWKCVTGFAGRLWGSQQVCCPLVVPYSSANSNARRPPCGVACDSGYYWDSTSYTCAACAGTIAPGFVWGDNCSSVFDCELYAEQAGLAIPQNARWPTTATNQKQCLWSCDAGYLQNEGLCCLSMTPGRGLPGREWVPGACATRCRSGLFAAEPGDPCVGCSQYLSDLGIDYCERCVPHPNTC
jgi:hypothetical protein